MRIISKAYKKLLLTALGVLVTSGLLLTKDAMATSPNLLSDADSKLTSGLGNWTAFDYGSGTFKTMYGYTGSPSSVSTASGGWSNYSYLKITGTGFGNSGATLKHISVKPNTDYIISARLRIPQSGTMFYSGGALAVTTDADDFFIKTIYNVNPISATVSNWIKVTDTFNSGGQNGINIRLNRGDLSEIDVTDIQVKEYTKPSISSTPVPSSNYVNLLWNANDDGNFIYKVYKKGLSDTQFQSIPLKQNIKVLNIYPYSSSMSNISFTNWRGESFTLPSSAGLKMWMETPNAENPKGYGMGLVDVDSVQTSDFNTNPSYYLKNGDGSYKYDVIFYGAWDCNAGNNLNTGRF